MDLHLLMQQHTAPRDLRCRRPPPAIPMICCTSAYPSSNSTSSTLTSSSMAPPWCPPSPAAPRLLLRVLIQAGGMASCAMPATCSMKFPIQTESCARSALHHHGMLRRGMLPNEFTLSFVLKACTRVQAWATRRWSMPWSWNWASCSKCLWVTRLCIPMRWLVPLEILVWPF
jgi:hypothetical protein